MKRIGFVSVVSTIFLSLSAFAQGTFCTQTFNVYGPAYASGVQARLDRLAKEIEAEPCEVFQFQELWRENHYSSLKNNLSRTYQMIRADDIRQDGSIIGLASAVDGLLLESHSALFDVNNEGGVFDGIRDAAGVQKGYTFLSAQVGNSPNLLLINLHTHPDNEAIRLAQVTQVIGSLLETPGALEKPLILTADLNATPDSKEVFLLKTLLGLRDSYIEANESYGLICTYCGDNPLSWSKKNRVIDFVLIGNSLSHKLKTKSSVVNLKGQPRDPLSDHYGVRSILAWDRQTERELSLMDPLVQGRIKNAIQALKAAISIVGRERGQGFRDSAQVLKQWLQGFESGKLSPGFERIARTP